MWRRRRWGWLGRRSDGGEVREEEGWKKTRRGQHNDEKGILARLAFSGCTL